MFLSRVCEDEIFDSNITIQSTDVGSGERLQEDFLVNITPFAHASAAAKKPTSKTTVSAAEQKRRSGRLSGGGSSIDEEGGVDVLCLKKPSIVSF